MLSAYRKIAALFAIVFCAAGCAPFSPNEVALKNLPAPDSFYAKQREHRLVSADSAHWRKWLADFSGRDFSPSCASYAPGNAVIYGNGYSINFHEKHIVLNFDGEQFVCERVPADTAFLIFLEKQSRTGINPTFRPLY